MSGGAAKEVLRCEESPEPPAKQMFPQLATLLTVLKLMPESCHTDPEAALS